LRSRVPDGLGDWVGAFTIVLTGSLSISWAGANGAAIAALATLGVMPIATGGVVRLGFDMTWIQFAIGVFLLLFRVRWMTKAVARQAGTTGHEGKPQSIDRRGRSTSTYSSRNDGLHMLHQQTRSRNLNRI
jgi:uncharacterized membrane protein